MNNTKIQNIEEQGIRGLDELLSEFNAQQPVVANNDSFIDSIMDSLPDRPNTQQDDKNTETENIPTLVIILRIVSSIAASLVIGLFILQNFNNISNQPIANNEIESKTYSPKYSEMSKCTTVEEALKLYAEKKHRNINRLKSLYNEN